MLFGIMTNVRTVWDLELTLQWFGSSNQWMTCCATSCWQHQSCVTSARRTVTSQHCKSDSVYTLTPDLLGCIQWARQSWAVEPRIALCNRLSGAQAVGAADYSIGTEVFLRSQISGTHNTIGHRCIGHRCIGSVQSRVYRFSAVWPWLLSCELTVFRTCLLHLQLVPGYLAQLQQIEKTQSR